MMGWGIFVANLECYFTTLIGGGIFLLYQDGREGNRSDTQTNAGVLALLALHLMGRQLRYTTRVCKDLLAKC